MLHRLEAEKTRSAAKAQAEAQSQVPDEVSRILSVERAVAQESLQQAIIRERLATEEEKLRAQLLVSLSANSCCAPSADHEHFSCTATDKCDIY